MQEENKVTCLSTFPIGTVENKNLQDTEEMLPINTRGSEMIGSEHTSCCTSQDKKF